MKRSLNFIFITCLAVTVTYGTIDQKVWFTGEPIPTTDTSLVFHPGPEHQLYRDSIKFSGRARGHLEYSLIRHSEDLFDADKDHDNGEMGNLSLYTSKYFGSLFFRGDNRTYVQRSDADFDNESISDILKNVSDYLNVYEAVAGFRINGLSTQLLVSAGRFNIAQDYMSPHSRSLLLSADGMELQGMIYQGNWIVRTSIGAFYKGYYTDESALNETSTWFESPNGHDDISDLEVDDLKVMAKLHLTTQLNRSVLDIEALYTDLSDVPGFELTSNEMFGRIALNTRVPVTVSGSLKSIDKESEDSSLQQMTFGFSLGSLSPRHYGLLECLYKQIDEYDMTLLMAEFSMNLLTTMPFNHILSVQGRHQHDGSLDPQDNMEIRLNYALFF
jgi:hypothetical protein